MDTHRRTAAASLFVSVCALVIPAGAVTEVSLLVADASFLGEAAGDHAGAAVAEAGDVNADGYADFLIGSPCSDDGGVDAGQVYLVLGTPVGLVADMQLSSVGASFVGEGSGDNAGFAIAGGGDVDGDGYDDFLVGAPYSSQGGPNAGRVYLLFGRSSGWSHGTSLADADVSFTAEGDTNLAGYALDLAPDVNGDGFDDVVIGAPWNSHATLQTGKVYVSFGGVREGWVDDVPLSSSDASFVGENENDYLGNTVAGVGDLDGDGISDIVASAPLYLSGSWQGKTYVFYGADSGWTLNEPASSSAASFLGESLGAWAGWSLGGADVNGDGMSNLILGAPKDDENGSSGDGQAYLVHGVGSGWSPNTDLALASSSMLPSSSAGELGWSVASAHDVNGDGFEDMLFGVHLSDSAGIDSGETLLLLGHPHGAQEQLHDVDAFISYQGEGAGDQAGEAACGVGDVDGDSLGDVLVGAPLNDDAGTDAGKVYLVLGEACAGDDNDGDGWTDCHGDCDDSDATLHGDDADEDGYTSCGGDCNDFDPNAYPDAAEICDGIDNDCDGNSVVWDMDSDGDGWSACEGDCSDADPQLHPGDEDADGFSPCDGDCDDTDAGVSPVSVETCDGVDTDCDGVVGDEELDLDADGYAECQDDCDDSNASVFPGADEQCDGLDNDCDGQIDNRDMDGDGFLPEACGGQDCDDDDASAHPGAIEECDDGVDSDCDGIPDSDEPECASTGDDDDDDAVGDDDELPQTDSNDESQAASCECGHGLRGFGRPGFNTGLFTILMVACWRLVQRHRQAR